MPWFKTTFSINDWFRDPFSNKVPLETQVTVFENIKYGDEDICKLDVYMPEGYAEGDPVPVIMNIHGGGWIAGDKYMRRGQGYLYSDRGIAVVNINYGLSPEYKYHEVIKHCFLAMKWIYDNAKKFNFDMSQFFVMGDSAGAQLGCLMLATQNNPKFKKELGVVECDARFKSGVLICGPYDADVTVDNPMSVLFIKDMTGKSRKEIEDYEHYDAFRTLDWVDEDFPDDVFIIFGKYDMIVNKQQQLSLIEKLDKLGKRHYEYMGPGNHCYHLYYRLKKSQVFYKLVYDYFDQMLDSSRDKRVDKKLYLAEPVVEESKLRELEKEIKQKMKFIKTKFKEFTKENKKDDNSEKELNDEKEEK